MGTPSACETNETKRKVPLLRQNAHKSQVWFCGWTICRLFSQSTAAQLCCNEPQNDVGSKAPRNKVNK